MIITYVVEAARGDEQAHNEHVDFCTEWKWKGLFSLFWFQKAESSL